MARILRGEIRWADLNPTRGREQAGQRPVLILSNDIFNERSGTVIAVALTSDGPQRTSGGQHGVVQYGPRLERLAQDILAAPLAG